MTPWLGHANGGSVTKCVVSIGIFFIYSFTRSTAIISFSVSVKAFTTPPKAPVMDRAYVIAKPMSPRKDKKGLRHSEKVAFFNVYLFPDIRPPISFN